MQCLRSRCLRLLPSRVWADQTRNAWVLKRRRILPEKYTRPTWISPYIVGDFIKDVNPQPEYPETYDLYCHETADRVEDNVNPKIKVILLDNVDGIGGKGDIVQVNARTARRELLLSKRAVYASDFNLKYYDDMIRNKVALERPSSLLSPFTQRFILGNVFTAIMSDTNEWKLSIKHVLAALRQGGLICSEDAVEMPENISITGPDPKKNLKVLLVHIKINNHERVPAKIMIIHHKTVLKEEYKAGKLEPLLEEQRALLDSLPIIKRTSDEVEDVTFD